MKVAGFACTRGVRASVATASWSIGTKPRGVRYAVIGSTQAPRKFAKWLGARMTARRHAAPAAAKPIAAVGPEYW